MPVVNVEGLRINYEAVGDGEPLLLIPALGADVNCFALQVPDYARHFTCISVDLPGAGASDALPGPSSTVGYADHMAAFLDAIGIEPAHVSGLSLGSAVATHLAARHPDRVRSLTLSSTWDVTDALMRVRIENWCALARALPSVTDALILGVFPWCFTPEMYAERPEFVAQIEAFTRSLTPQSLNGFLGQADAVLGHDASRALGQISAPTLITFGARDQVTSTRFVDPLREGIPHAELVVFDHLGHAGLNEDPDAFTDATLEFLLRHAS
jgi:pimeloyl-ACP methyl ester carboxylesterase